MSAPQDIYAPEAKHVQIVNNSWPTREAAMSLGFYFTLGAIFAVTLAIIVGKLVNLVWSLFA